MKKVIILISIILFLLAGINVYSQAPAPTPSILSQSQQNKTTPQQTKPNYKERGSDDLPLVIKIVGSNESQYKEGNYTKNANENTTTNWLLVIFNGFLAVFTFLLVCYNKKMWETTKDSIKLTQDSIKLGIDEFIANHPPKLKVHTIIFNYKPVPTFINDGKDIIVPDWNIQCLVTNIGGSSATIKECKMTFKRLKEPFPIILPFSDEQPWVLSIFLCKIPIPGSNSGDTTYI